MTRLSGHKEERESMTYISPILHCDTSRLATRPFQLSDGLENEDGAEICAVDVL